MPSIILSSYPIYSTTKKYLPKGTLSIKNNPSSSDIPPVIISSDPRATIEIFAYFFGCCVNSSTILPLIRPDVEEWLLWSCPSWDSKNDIDKINISFCNFIYLFPLNNCYII